jgi:hypothetical protein
MDKLAEEILKKYWIIKYDKRGHDSGSKIIFHNDAILAMQSYHEVKLKEELIKFLPWVENGDGMVADMKFVNKIVDEYIKIRKL